MVFYNGYFGTYVVHTDEFSVCIYRIGNYFGRSEWNYILLYLSGERLMEYYYSVRVSFDLDSSVFVRIGS